MRKRGFTLLELLIATAISTLLLLLLYEIYGQVAKSFFDIKEKRNFNQFLKISQGLRLQLDHISSQKINYNGRNLVFFYWKDGLLAFLTDFGPGGQNLVMYKEKNNQLLYSEIPYTGQRIPENPWDILEDFPEKSVFNLGKVTLSLIETYDQEKEKISEWVPGQLPEEMRQLMIKISLGRYTRLLPLDLSMITPKP